MIDVNFQMLEALKRIKETKVFLGAIATEMMDDAIYFAEKEISQASSKENLHKMRVLSEDQLRFISDTAYYAGASAENEACAELVKIMVRYSDGHECAKAIRERMKK